MPSIKLPHIVRKLCVALLLCICAGLSHASVADASAITYKGITLTPAIVNLDLQKGQTKAVFNIQVANNTRTPQTLTLSSIDFKSLNETGGVAFIGSKASQIDHKYGLAPWLDLGSDNLELTPGQTKIVSITVNNRSDLSPGGHYAAVLFKSTNDDSSGGGANRVAINEVVSSLIFVRKVEGAKYGLGLKQLSVPSSWFRLPTSVDVVFKNTGNTQLVPRGLITVTGPFSREVSRGIINTDSNLVLPESNRLYQAALTKTGHAWLPGVYHATVQYRYDGTATLQTATATFFYASPRLVSAILGIFVVLGYCVRQRRYIYRWVKRARKRYL